MYTLFYPAVLGSMFVAVISNSAINSMWYGDFKIQFAIFLIVYFSSQHLQNTDDRDNYNYPRLVSDIFELALMLPLFVLLGMTNSEYAIGRTGGYTWAAFYLLLFAAFMAPVASRACENKWNPFKQNEGRGLSVLSCLAAIGALVGLKYNESGLLLICLSGLLAVYFIFFVFKD